MSKEKKILDSDVNQSPTVLVREKYSALSEYAMWLNAGLLTGIFVLFLISLFYGSETE